MRSRVELDSHRKPSSSRCGLVAAALVMAGALSPAQAQVSGNGTVGTIPVWNGANSLGSTSPVDATASQNLFVTGPSPWLDVKAAGALGDTQTVADGATSGTGPPYTHITSATANWVSGDLHKAISIDSSPFPAPLVPAIAAMTSGCMGTAAIDTSAGALGLYYRVAYAPNTGASGKPSLEGFVFLPQSTAKYCVSIASPGSLVGASKYQVYVSLDSTGSAAGLASGTEVLQNPAAHCSNGAPMLANTCEIDSVVLPAPTTVIGASRSLGVATVTVAASGSYGTGTWVRIASVFPNNSFNGTWQILSGGNPVSSFTIKQPNLPDDTGSSFTGSSATATTTVPHGAPVVLGTISSVNNSSDVTISVNIPNTAANATVSWGTDDTTAINSAIASTTCAGPATTGCKLYFPPGRYWIQGQGVLIAKNQAFFYLIGAGASSSRAVGPGNPGNTAATSELVVADQSYALTVGSSGGVAANGGPRISNLGFRDDSGAGNALGGIHLLTVAHAYLDNLAFADFTLGTGVFFDAGGTGATPPPFSQYNFVINPTAVNVRAPFLFSGGGSASNWFIGGNLAGAETGGGACFDLQGYNGNPAGGHNYFFYPQCNFFPVALHLFDQNSDAIFVHAEQTDASTPSVVGSPNSGTGILVDGTSSINCLDNQISSTSLTSFADAIYVGANCTHTIITSPTYPNTAKAPLTDLGTNTQTIGAPPSAQNLALAGPGSSLLQYFAVASGSISAGDLLCMSGTTLQVQRCTATSAGNALGVAAASATGGGGVIVGVQFAGVANVSIDAATVAPGNFVCVSSTNAGKGSISATACTTKQIGIAIQSSGGVSVTSTAVFLQKY